MNSQAEFTHERGCRRCLAAVHAMVDLQAEDLCLLEHWEQVMW